MFKSGAENVGKAFSQFKNSVVNAQQSLTAKAQQLTERFLEEVTGEELQVFGNLWETSENVEMCRVCRCVFETVLSGEKHHCRACGSVICLTCSEVIREEQLTPFVRELIPPALCSDVITDSSKNKSTAANSRSGNQAITNAFAKIAQPDANSWRLCRPCLLGHGPSKHLKSTLQTQLTKQYSYLSGFMANGGNNIIDHVGTKLVAKVNEVVGVKDRWQFQQGTENLPLFSGRYYPDHYDSSTYISPRSLLPRYSGLHSSTVIGYNPPISTASNVSNNNNVNIPSSGYIEIVNKSSNTDYAVKVLFLPANDNMFYDSQTMNREGGLSAEQLNQLLAHWQSKVLFEGTRPSFTLLSPGETCFSFVGSGDDIRSNAASFVVAILVLHTYTTQDLYPPVVSTTNNNNRKSFAYGFTKARVYYYDVRRHHLLLKLKESALLLPRQGDNVGRIGLINRLFTGKKGGKLSSNSEIIDFAHNVAGHLKVFDLA